MKRNITFALVFASLALTACTTTRQQATADFRPPSGAYKVIVMHPDVSVSLLTASGQLEPREDWTDQASTNVLAALSAQQAKRGGNVTIDTQRVVGTDQTQVSQLNRLHEAVGRSIRLHKYTPGQALPSKTNAFDWTLGELAVDYGKATGYDYALFLHVEDSFSSGGRVALQAVSALGCVVGVCVIPAGGQQIAFISLVDLKSGNVVWYNFLNSAMGDVRTPQGASDMVDHLLETMKPGQAPKT